MTREIKIRTVPNLTFFQLKWICEKYEFTSFNQFMLDQLQNIVNNDGLNLYQNQFATTLSEIKSQQKEILDQLLKNEIRQIGLDAKQEVVEKLTTDWLKFIDDLDALEAEK
ncbi:MULTISPECIES: hypothetical protein [Streptococcus]|uniref:hypothetical protein n=1 Tax=Streptococcus TaxID=1301 RepID=UPI000E3D8295|nr:MULTISPECIES: hypothetical protein [Streptococcus anginosus group]MCW1026965.1 hypothetical protein [Streptococcus anginosus]MDX5003782.1 hypothetical protein [Streptococcus anginosus]MDX5025337.1 hypothetical protein [Streptococcus anginosus]MDX5033361.1 hypothetical protein [Streptococcus anginosus]MDX5100497.1 hypothetical protein [Streptococcus anginosus]